MRRSILAGILAGLLIPAAWVTSAQEPATPEPVVVEVEVDGWTYQYDGNEPLILYVEETLVTKEGRWVTYLPLARLPDGSITQLTPCDDIVVSCAPLRTRATAALDGVNVGDALVLSGEAITDD